jgi:hypothetical protein
LQPAVEVHRVLGSEFLGTEHRDEQIEHQADGDDSDEDFKHASAPFQQSNQEQAQPETDRHDRHHAEVEHGSTLLVQD